MAIVEAAADNSGLFSINLPEQATAEQNSLKKKIDDLLDKLKQNPNDPDYSARLKRLREIAEGAFNPPEGDLTAAIKAVDAFANEIAGPPPQTKVSAFIGAFEVALPDPTVESDKGISWREIIFDVTGELIPIPPQQLKLKAEIEATLTTLQAIFPNVDADEKPKTLTAPQRRFSAYQTKLVGIAQTGLQTPADPESSRLWLESFQSDVVLQEGPRIKNGYMKSLGIAAAGLAVVAALIYLALRNNPHVSELLYAYRNLFVMWVGTMVGAWLSFGIRRPNIRFKDLGAPEDDMVQPLIRLIFTGFVALTIAFIFVCKMVNVNVGGLNSADLLSHGSSALLIGMLFGVSEQALPGALARRASQFVSDVGGQS